MRNRIKKILKEENEWDWARESEPISKSEIGNKLLRFGDFGFHIYNAETSDLVNSIYDLGLNTTQLDNLIKSLYSFGYNIYERGMDAGGESVWSEGHREGYNEGWSEAKIECENDADYKYDEGHEEGMIKVMKRVNLKVMLRDTKKVMRKVVKKLTIKPLKRVEPMKPV